MPRDSITKADTSAVQDQVTVLINTALSSHFATLNNSHLKALFHLSEIFKKATDPEPIAPTIPITITDVTPPRVTQYAPQRLSVSLVPSLRLSTALPRVPDSHLTSTKISSLKFNFAPLTTQHKNTESTFPVTPRVTYSQRTGNLGHLKWMRAKELAKKPVSTPKCFHLCQRLHRPNPN